MHQEFEFLLYVPIFRPLLGVSGAAAGAESVFHAMMLELWLLTFFLLLGVNPA
jgi:hypothetical protein